MRKKLFIFLVIFLAVIFQISVFPLFFSRNNIPDLALIILVSSVAVLGFQQVLVWAVISGFIFDIFSFSRIGVNIFSFVLFSYAISFFSRRMILGEKSGGILMGAIFVSFMTFFYRLWAIFNELGLNFQEIWKMKTEFLEGMGWKIIFNLILFFLSILFLKRIRNKISPKNNIYPYTKIPPL
ncbi:MAG: rod shape-determining protein MreD [Patescibacteria group bacterium]